MASETWSAILSGCPSVTDSEVNRWRFFDKRVLLSKRFGRYVWRGMIKRPHEMQCFCGLEKATRERAEAQSFWPELWILAASGVPSGAEGRGHGFGCSCPANSMDSYWRLVVWLALSCWLWWLLRSLRGGFRFSGGWLQAVGIEGQGFDLSVVALGG